uniref:protein acetyllysine N-acetyltransferase n=1 Tax=Aureoumbra lagunensis TaxID=44058 RepID=A0A7S3NLP1_9STRA|mmetsp:Transcript_15609/g.23493  ORF Transcript_15609/g.23493 Transcript_15609/m.23493 type:complete len:352 (-) Transcript_15609:33-1088(-)
MASTIAVAKKEAERTTVLGYASRLSAYANRGVTGLPELHDNARVLKTKLKTLKALVQAASNVVALTGAGISVAAGIPDFRGPQGIWTLEDKAKREGDKRKKRKKNKIESVDTSIAGASFETAEPTKTHLALVALQKAGKLSFCATQNVDRLHITSGMPRDRLAILHGCVFTEQCETCDYEVVHDRDLGGVSFQSTGNLCPRCGDNMRDTVLDWNDGIQDQEWEPSVSEFKNADLALCLGTSLRITPAADLPLMSKKFVIINLQQTPLDDRAALIIRANVDDVLTTLLSDLGISMRQTTTDTSSNNTHVLATPHTSLSLSISSSQRKKDVVAAIETTTSVDTTTTKKKRRRS